MENKYYNKGKEDRVKKILLEYTDYITSDALNIDRLCFDKDRFIDDFLRALNNKRQFNTL